jgi:hypothetical protein
LSDTTRPTIKIIKPIMKIGAAQNIPKPKVNIVKKIETSIKIKPISTAPTFKV